MLRSSPFIASLLILGLGCGGATRTAAPATGTTPEKTSDPFDSTPPEPSIAITDAMGNPHVGDAAPDFTLAGQDGQTVTLASLRGKVVMLAFVTSWCPFSEAEQPHLAKLATDYANDDRVRVVAIDVKEPDDGYAKYLARVSMPFPVVRDRTGEVTLSFTPPGAQPTFKDRSLVLVTSNLVLDPEGKIRFFTLADTVHFDARLVHARRAIDAILAETKATP
jgi:peroxiredoxin